MAFAVWLAFALAILLLGGAIYYAAHVAFAQQMDASIEQAGTGVMADYRDDGIGGLSEAIRQREGRGVDALGYALFDPRGRQIAGSMNTAMPSVGWRTIVF